MSDKTFDRRLTPARPDLAAAHLQGQVQAARYVQGQATRIAEPVVDLRPRPDDHASLDTQALFGEAATVYERQGDWAWVQLGRDDYVGYVKARALAAPADDRTHRVASLRAPIFSGPNLKTPSFGYLPMNAEVAVTKREGRFAKIGEGRWLAEQHIADRNECAADWVSVAEAMMGAPYLWGGKTPDGLDCSGLVQTALHAAGQTCPRDTDMQEKSLGVAVDPHALLRRGDLIFWKGHVGIMRSATELLHANAFHMMVASEPAAQAIARIEAGGAKVAQIRRLDIVSRETSTT